LSNDSVSKLVEGGVIGNMVPVAAGSGVEQVEADELLEEMAGGGGREVADQGR